MWDGEWLTPDDPFDVWLRYALEEGKGLNDTQVPELFDGLLAAGFTRVPEDGAFENGWHPGQTVDPDVIRRELLAEHGDDIEVVFALVENSQFYIRFAAYWRLPEPEED